MEESKGKIPAGGTVLQSRHRLARTLIFYLLTGSVVLTLLSTSFQLYRDYLQERAAIDSTMEQIESTYLQGIAMALWALNYELLETQADGILRLSEIHYIEMVTEEEEHIFAKGTPRTASAIVRDFPVLYQHKGRHRSLGVLHVESDLTLVHKRLFDRLLFILVTQGIQIFLVSLLLFVLFYFLIAKPLTVMAGYTESFKLNQLTTPLRLKRPLKRRNSPDELDLLVKSINEMRINLLKDMARRQEAEDALQAYSDGLQGLVEERTRELQDTQEALVRKEKLATLGQLAGSVAHELRHPLGVLANSVYFLKMTLSDRDEATTEYLELMSKEIETSDKIISDLLGFSRRQSERHVTREAVPLASLVSELLTEHPPPPGIETCVDLGADMPPAWIDRQHIKQVLMNLIVNAYQAMPSGGTLTVISEQLSANSPEVLQQLPNTDNDLLITVKDTGNGISAENIQKLFEPLFSTKPKGIGLGLPISKTLIEANGGSIEVESEEGHGAIFRITLPCQ